MRKYEFVWHQEEEEASEGAEEAEGEGGAEDGPAWRLHRRFLRLFHVLTQRYKEETGEDRTAARTRMQTSPLGWVGKLLYVDLIQFVDLRC